jgi:hypothetical protein
MRPISRLPATLPGAAQGVNQLGHHRHGGGVAEVTQSPACVLHPLMLAVLRSIRRLQHQNFGQLAQTEERRLLICSRWSRSLPTSTLVDPALTIVLTHASIMTSAWDDYADES